MKDDNKLKIDEIYFEQYKILVNSYDSLQDKRASTNNYLVFLYSSIIGLYNFINSTSVSPLKSSFSIYSLAIFVSIIWAAIILKYIRAEKIKHDLIKEAEKNMPLKIFTQKKGESGISNSKIASTSAIELLLPITLLILFSLDFYFNIS